MAELDYAFIAEYARVDAGGKLTSVGASYTKVRTEQLPFGHLIAVAGRVRSTVGSPPVHLRVLWKLPGAKVSMSMELSLEPDQDAEPYEGLKLGLVFAVTTLIPIAEAGLCTAEIFIDGEEARLLAFEVVLEPRTS